MTDLAQSSPSPGIRPLAIASVLCAAALTLLFGHALAAYWAFYHLGSGGTGLFLVLFVLPFAFALSINIIFFTARRMLRRGHSVLRAIALAALVDVVVLALLLSGEIWRTTAMRSGEGEGAGDLAPYVLYHVR